MKFRKNDKHYKFYEKTGDIAKRDSFNNILSE